MSETWAVIDEAGVIHEVDVSEGRTGSPPWVAHVADGTARRSLTSARDAVVLMAQARGWGVAEVVAPGDISLRERMSAEVDRLTARDHDAGVVIEDLRKMLAGANADLVVAREDAEQARSERDMTADEVERRGDMIRGMRAEITQARLDGAREMRERAAGLAQIAGDTLLATGIRALPLPEAPAPQPVAWGAMPTAAEVAAHVARAEQYAHGGAPWLRRYVAFDGSAVTGIEVVYLYVDRERVMTRRPTHGVVYGATAREIASEWRPVDGDGVAVGGAQ